MMGRLPEYPPQIRERAIELVTKEDYSYSQAAEQLKEEFKDTDGIETISKSTVYRWVKQYRKHEEKTKKEEETKEEKAPEPEPEKPKEEPPQTPSKEAVEELATELKELPKTTPQQVVKELNESITPVPEGPLMKEAEFPKEEETSEDKAKGIADKLLANRSKLLWSLSLTLAVTVVALLIYRWWSRKKSNEVSYHYQPSQQPQVSPEKQNYKQLTSLDQFDETPDDGYVDAEVLP